MCFFTKNFKKCCSDKDHSCGTEQTEERKFKYYKENISHQKHKQNQAKYILKKQQQIQIHYHK